MKQNHGFVSIDAFTNNTAGVVAALGELSKKALTFSTESTEHRSAIFPGLELTSFRTVTGGGLATVLSFNEANHVLQIASFIKQYGLNNIRPISIQALLAALNGEFSDITELFILGPGVDNGTCEMPEWVSWHDKQNDVYNKIWFSSVAFESQYSFYEIKVIPPLVDLDSLNGSFNSVTLAVNGISYPALMERVETAKDNKPETVIRFINYKRMNLANPAQYTNTPWVVVIYGNAGNTNDTIQNAVIDYITTNSNNALSAWQANFPEIFQSNEFMLYPRWDKISIENLTSESSMNSPVTDPKETTDFILANLDFYTDEHIRNNIRVYPVVFNNLSVVIVNGEYNIPGSEDISLIYPDYINVSSISSDYIRMGVSTRDWIETLTEALVVANTITTNSTIPSIYTRLIRSNQLYLGFEYENRQFYVAARSNSFYGA